MVVPRGRALVQEKEDPVRNLRTASASWVAACAWAVACLAGGASGEDLLADGDWGASLPEIAGIPPLPAYTWRDATGFSIAAGVQYLSWDSTNTGLSATTFGLTRYAESITRGEGPVFLQPLLQGASWWSFYGGPADLDTSSSDYDGTAFSAECVAMGDDGLGVRLGYTRLESEDSALEMMSASFALLYDYTRGGRIGLTFEDRDNDTQFYLGPLLITIVDDAIRYGVEWTHVWTFGDAAMQVEASYKRVQADMLDSDDADDSFQERLAFFPVRELGLVVTASQEHGDLKDAEGIGGGIFIDLEQVGITVEYSIVDDQNDPDGTLEVWSGRLELRF